MRKYFFSLIALVSLSMVDIGYSANPPIDTNQ